MNTSTSTVLYYKYHNMEKKEFQAKDTCEEAQKTENVVEDYYEAESWQFSGC